MIRTSGAPLRPRRVELLMRKRQHSPSAIWQRTAQRVSDVLGVLDEGEDHGGHLVRTEQQTHALREPTRAHGSSGAWRGPKMTICVQEVP